MEANRTLGDGQPAIGLAGVGLLREGRWILKGVDWEVAAGQCVAILGPNGSGKSTLARIVACHLWPTEGNCTVLGHPFGQTNLLELRKSIRLLQPAGPYDVDPSLTAREIVLTGFFASLNLYDEATDAQRQQAGGLLTQVGLGHVKDQAYWRLSSGERVRSLLARALAGRPRLLLLDEPTAGLDLRGREQLLSIVSQLAAGPDAPTIVVITHHIEELTPVTSQVLLLHEGHVAAVGKPAEVLRGEIMSKVYGVALEVVSEGGRFYVRMK